MTSTSLKLNKFDPRVMEHKRLNGHPSTCIFIGKRSTGKCLGKDTPVLLFDGTIKKVQDIEIGDILMGDDTKSRKVLNLSKGRSKLYKVRQTRGDDYVVNENHVLSLKVTRINDFKLLRKKYTKGAVVDIAIKEFLALPIVDKLILKGYKHGNKDESTITVEEFGFGEYYGFEVDGNHRFLLGDSTVTHNSTLITDIMYFMRRIPYGLIMSGTEDGSSFYSNYFPSLFIHSEYKKGIIQTMINRQKKLLKEKSSNPYAFLLLDDLMYDKSVVRDQNMRQIFMNGRHWKLTLLLSMQYCMDLPPDLRANVDYLFILRENIIDNQKKLWKYFFGMFPTLVGFQQTLNACTENYECLVLDNTCKSNSIEDCVYWYKATPNRIYRIGCKQLWEYAKEHFNKDYEKEEETGTAIQIKPDKEIIIKKKGVKDQTFNAEET